VERWEAELGRIERDLHEARAERRNTGAGAAHGGGRGEHEAPLPGVHGRLSELCSTTQRKYQMAAVVSWGSSSTLWLLTTRASPKTASRYPQRPAKSLRNKKEKQVYKKCMWAPALYRYVLGANDCTQKTLSHRWTKSSSIMHHDLSVPFLGAAVHSGDGYGVWCFELLVVFLVSSAALQYLREQRLPPLTFIPLATARVQPLQERLRTLGAPPSLSLTFSNILLHVPPPSPLVPPLFPSSAPHSWLLLLFLTLSNGVQCPAMCGFWPCSCL